jgi:hypothetical protein
VGVVNVLVPDKVFSLGTASTVVCLVHRAIRLVLHAFLSGVHVKVILPIGFVGPLTIHVNEADTSTTAWSIILLHGNVLQSVAVIGIDHVSLAVRKDILPSSMHLVLTPGAHILSLVQI